MPRAKFNSPTPAKEEFPPLPCSLPDLLGESQSQSCLIGAAAPLASRVAAPIRQLQLCINTASALYNKSNIKLSSKCFSRLHFPKQPPNLFSWLETALES